jgi:hypothetical protein
MDVVLYSCCVVQKRRKEKRGWPGKVPRSPAGPPKEKERKNKPTARYLIGQEWRKGKGYKKKKKTIFKTRENTIHISFKPFAKRQLLCKL